MSILLRTQKNKLFELIQENGLSPEMFKLTDNAKLFLIAHHQSGYYYKVDETNRINISFSPAGTFIKDDYQLVELDNDILNNTFQRWIKSFKSEIALPDYWKILNQQMNDIGTYEFVNSDYFTEEESSQIQEKLKLISKEISNLPLLSDQIQAINNKLDTIASNVKKLDKISWRDHLIGGIIGIAAQYAITPENITLIWGILKSNLNTFHLLPL